VKVGEDDRIVSAALMKVQQVKNYVWGRSVEGGILE